MHKKRILICVGGSGGHIFPAQALAQQLLTKDKNCELLFVGGGLATNRFFDKQTFAYQEVSCGPLLVRNPLICMRSLSRLFRGWMNSKRILNDFKPHLVVGFGSYHTLPTLLAVKSLKIPLVLHAADSVPGKVIRLLSPYAEVTGIHFPEAAHWLKGKSCEVKMPLRDGFRFVSGTRGKAREYFHLDPKRLTILIMGGSQGATAINHLVMHAMKSLKEKLGSFQIVHFTGDPKVVQVFEEMYEQLGIQAYVKSFESRMDLAWSAADIAITRAGASSIAEQIEFEVPGILIPYPHGADQHQQKNAEFFTTKIGGAIRFSEKEMTPQKLVEVLKNMIKEERTLLKGMRRAIHLYKNSVRRKDLSELVFHFLEKRKSHERST